MSLRALSSSSCPDLGGAKSADDPHWSWRDHRTMAEVMESEGIPVSAIEEILSSAGLDRFPVPRHFRRPLSFADHRASGHAPRHGQ